MVLSESDVRFLVLSESDERFLVLSEGRKRFLILKLGEEEYFVLSEKKKKKEDYSEIFSEDAFKRLTNFTFHSTGCKYLP